MQEVVYHSNYQIESSYWWFTARAYIIHALMKRYCRLQPGDVVMDVGCGTGGFLQTLAQDYTAIGLDTSETAIKYCRQRGLTHLYQMTLDQFPKNEWNIKAMTMLDVIEHIKDDKAVVRQAFDLLSPGGYFIAAVPAYQWLWSTHDELHMHERRYAKLDFEHLLTEAGFEIIKSTYYNTFLFLPAVVKRLLERNKTYTSESDVVDPVPDSINRLFDAIFRAEAPFLKHISFPFGISILTICRKPQ